MLPEQTPELTLANSQPRRQGFDVAVVEGARFNQPERPGYRIGAPTPEGKLG